MTFIAATERHTAENISLKLSEELNNCKIGRNSITLTLTNNKANMTAAVKILCNDLERCLSHTMNIVTEISSASNASTFLEKVRYIAINLKQNNDYNRLFKSVQSQQSEASVPKKYISDEFTSCILQIL